MIIFPFRVTCDLIPLAVLKPDRVAWNDYSCGVTCDLIPLAVLKLNRVLIQRFGFTCVTCDLIPLAVLKHGSTMDNLGFFDKSHVISYRLRY